MTPISSIATIDDLIVALLRLGYKKTYDEYQEGKIETLHEENYKNVFRVFIYHKNKPEDDVCYGDVGLAAEVVAEFYPYIKNWYFGESYAGSHEYISWETAETIHIEEIDKNLDLWVKSWKKQDAK